MKNQFKITGVVLGLALSLGQMVLAQENSTEQLKYFKDLPQAGSLDGHADEGLSFFQRRAAEGHAKTFSLNSPSEASGVQRGQPILHYFVRLDELRAYQSGQDPKSLLGKVTLVTYPLVSGSDIKGAVNLGWDGSSWKLVSVGGPAFMLKWDNLRRGQSSKNGKNLEEFFAVRVPALDEDFVGYYDEQSALFLVPGRNNPILGWQAGEALPAQEVFTKLAGVAQNYHDKPYFQHK